MTHMKFVLAPDSFKESMTAKQVCVAMEQGFKTVFPDAEFVHVPMADGGEGTVQSLVDATGGKLFQQEVTGPLGSRVKAGYGVLGDGKTAVIEMASASGIQYINAENRNPLIATSYGTGELIKACLHRGIRRIIIGIGGSATNDGGAGMAQALGVKLLDGDGGELPYGGGALGRLHDIDLSGLDPAIGETEIIVACDVTNPLCGEHGASAVFGPQKGATAEMIQTLDGNLAHYAMIIRQQLRREVGTIAGAGAAGGLGAGLLAFTQCELKKGIDIIIDFSKLNEKLAGADYCITGEGGIDFQTKFGKTPYGVAKAAKVRNVPVIALAGRIGKGTDELYQEGIDAIFGIIPDIGELESLLSAGQINITRASENIGRLLKIATHKPKVMR
ncbi:glycerate kinase [Sodalis sp. dw_96]|uniref:glycerate kinase family protein n=1 Tax=Sodalis sp. dw_96 TaxID=2719794 RepID=UPI00210518C5|nr:glycerate kinase [Sodalis sp. dw_96]